MKKLFHPWVFLFAIIFLLVYKLVLLNIDEIFPMAYEIGDLIYEAMLAYFAGYIFYLLVEYFPKRRDKKTVYRYVNRKRDSIINNFYRFLDHVISEIEVVSNLVPEDPPTAARVFLAQELKKDEFDLKNMSIEKFEKVMRIIHNQDRSPVSQFPDLLNHLTWNQYFRLHSQSILKLVNEVFVVIPYLEPDHINIFTDIQDCSFFGLVNNIDVSQDCEFLANSIHKYYLLIRELEDNWQKE